MLMFFYMGQLSKQQKTQETMSTVLGIQTENTKSISIKEKRIYETVDQNHALTPFK